MVSKSLQTLKLNIFVILFIVLFFVLVFNHKNKNKNCIFKKQLENFVSNMEIGENNITNNQYSNINKLNYLMV